MFYNYTFFNFGYHDFFKHVFLINNIEPNNAYKTMVYLRKTRENAIVEYLDYQIPVTQLNGDMQAAKRD